MIRTVPLVIACTLLAWGGSWVPLRAVQLDELVHSAVEPQSLIYKHLDGSDLHLWHFPASNSGTATLRPALVLIHGGAWRAGDARIFFPHARYFAERGMVAFSVDYRLLTATGPGIGECLADCASAVRYIRTHAQELGVDVARIAVLGDSAGGHLAAALATTNGFDDPADDLTVSAIPDAMILCNAIFDLTEGDWCKFVMRGKALDPHSPPAELRLDAELLRAVRALSPRFGVHPHEPPALVMQGLDDHIVQPSQARAFTEAMRSVGARCDLELIPGARHAFIIAGYTATPDTVVAAICSADRFLASLGYIAGDPTLERSAR